MDLQTRKLELVKMFLNLQNEDTINRIEKLLRDSTPPSADVQGMTPNQLNFRINQSLEDSKNGKLIDLDDLIEEIEKWN